MYAYIVLHKMFVFLYIRPKKKKIYVALTRRIFENWVGRSIFFFFFFFLRTVRELSLAIFFFEVSKWGKLGRNAVKTHTIQVLFRPLNTNFSKFFAQI